MDSWKIAHGSYDRSSPLTKLIPLAAEIEKRYPTPSLGLDEPVVVQIRDHIGKMFGPLAANLFPKIPRNVLSDVSAEYFNRTREQMFGMPLEQFEKEKGVEENWEHVKGPAKEAGDLLRKHGGPFFLGERGLHFPLYFKPAS
jgi:hypothetical protein